MKIGRPRKFKLGAIAQHEDGHLCVIVDHQIRGTKSEYRVIPLDGRRRRYGRVAWTETSKLSPVGEKSRGSIVTYRANRMMEQDLGGRGCGCECCVHTAIPLSAFNHHTGDMKEEE